MASKKSKKSRKIAAVVLAVTGIAGLSLASAAQLNLGTSSLGAAAVVTASCQGTATAITSSFASAYSATAKSYTVSSVTLKNVAVACAGKTINLNLLASDPSQTGDAASLTTGTYAIPASYAAVADIPVPLAVTTVDAKAVNGLAVVIS